MAELLAQGVLALTTVGRQFEPVLLAQKPKLVLALGDSCPFQDRERAVRLLPLVEKVADQLEVTLLWAKFTTAVHDGMVADDALVTVIAAQ